MYSIFVILHLLGASVWVGGHIVLVSVVLPAARREGCIKYIVDFERSYGRLGLGALVIQAVTGFVLAERSIGSWVTFTLSTDLASILVPTKLVLLAANLGLAVHASRRLLPRLSPERIGAFAIHAWIVTLIAVLMVVLGVGIRTGRLL